MLSCKTSEFAAVCAGKAQMKHIDDEVYSLCEKLMPRIKSGVEEVEVTIRAKHGFITSIGIRIVEFFTKQKTVD